MRAVSFLFVSLAMVSLSGCPSDPVVADRPTCTLIFERCHPLDLGTGEIHECHESAENDATTEADCQAMQASCFAACTATDAGPTSDAGTADDAGL